MIHLASVTVDTPGVGSWDIAGITLVGATITHGSDDLWDFPDPSSLSMTVLDDSGMWRKRLTFTTRVTVTVANSIRFVGTITDLKVRYDGAWVLDVIAVGLKVAARTRLVAPRPAETAAERIAAVWAEVGMTVHAVDPVGSVSLLATLEAATASDVTHAAAAADLGYVTQRRDGSMWYRSRDVVAASQLVKAVIPADGVFPSSSWVKSIGALATRVVNGYGTADPQETVSVSDADLEADLGRWQEKAHSSIYADATGAGAIAVEVLDRMKDPSWRTDGLEIDLALEAYTLERTGNVLGLEVGDLVWVTGAPAGTPAGSEETYVVLGWDEMLDGTSHVISFRVVEYSIVREGARWGNVSISWKAAGSTPVGDYRFSPPTLAPGVAA